MMFLAQATNGIGGGTGLPDPHSAAAIGWVVVVLAALLASVNQALGVKAKMFPSVQRNEITPQPLEVRAVMDLARERDCVSRHDSLAAQISEIRTQRITDMKDAALSRKGLYEMMDAIKNEMAAMERRINTEDERRTSGVWDQLNSILEALGEVRGELKSKN